MWTLSSSVLSNVICESNFTALQFFCKYRSKRPAASDHLEKKRAYTTSRADQKLCPMPIVGKRNYFSINARQKNIIAADVLLSHVKIDTANFYVRLF